MGNAEYMGDISTVELQRLSRNELINLTRELFVAYSVLRVQFCRLSRQEQIKKSLESSFLNLVKRLQSEKTKNRELSQTNTSKKNPSMLRRSKTNNILIRSKSPQPNMIRSKFQKKKQSLVLGKTKVKLVKTTTTPTPKKQKSLKESPDTSNNAQNEEEDRFDDKDDEKETYLKQKEALIQKTDDLMEAKKTLDSAANGAQFMDKELSKKLNTINALIDDASSCND